MSRRTLIVTPDGPILGLMHDDGTFEQLGILDVELVMVDPSMTDREPLTMREIAEGIDNGTIQPDNLDAIKSEALEAIEQLLANLPSSTDLD